MGKKIQTNETLKSLLSQCSFNDWNIELKFDDTRPYVQISFLETCKYTGIKSIQNCRKYTLSYEMCDTEVVRTVFTAINQAMLHEIQESFKFKGRRIFNPHRDVYSLWEISDSSTIDVRNKGNI